jgi:hypothetical protein
MYSYTVIMATVPSADIPTIMKKSESKSLPICFDTPPKMKDIIPKEAIVFVEPLAIFQKTSIQSLLTFVWARVSGEL